MQAELTPAAIALVGLVVALFLHDLVSLGRNRRLLVLQALVFAVGATLIVFPEISRRLAHAVGIGRGVDFVMYPLVIWLVRESLLTRRRRHDDQAKLTEVVRSVAIANARVVDQRAAGSSTDRAPAQSVASSAS